MFEYTIDPSADEPIMLILKQIGNSHDDDGNITEYGVQGSDFCKELLLLDSMGKSRIQIWINSPGGGVVDGYSILGGMLKTKAKVDTYNIGLAASTAGWLFEAGRNRDMSDYATWMGHNPSSPDGEDSVIRQKFQESIVKVIAGRTGKTETEVATILDKETYMNAEECLAEGFCDTVTSTSKLNIKRMTAAKTLTDKYREATLIVNKILPKIKTDVMPEHKIDVSITNKLKLDEDASPAMVSKAITDLQNKLIVETDKVTTTQDSLNVVNKEKSDLQKKYDDLVKDMKKMKDDIDAEEEQNRSKEATDMVNGFAEAGKIENRAEIIKDWIDEAKVSKEAFEKVKNRLTALPVNKAAKKIEVVTTLTGAGGVKNLAMKMAAIAKKHGQK